MWEANEDNLESIAVGAGILGTGGGGNPYIGQLRARQAIRERGPVTVLDAEELPEDSQVICVGASARLQSESKRCETYSLSTLYRPSKSSLERKRPP